MSALVARLGFKQRLTLPSELEMPVFKRCFCIYDTLQLFSDALQDQLCYLLSVCHTKSWRNLQLQCTNV